MKLGDIYKRGLDRKINPAVVVSENDKETIDTEIREYIFTPELIENLYLLLDTVANKRIGKTGIWISGYYGSGKSHFIKYAHYCLDDDTSELAFEYFVSALKEYDTTKAGSKEEITESNLLLLKRKIKASQFNNILFNVEDVAGDAQNEKMTRIFLNMLNKFRNYNSVDIPLAILLEKHLDEEGKFEEFKQLVQSQLGFNWKEDAAKLAARKLDKVLQLAKQVLPDIDIVSLHNKLSNKNSYDITIEGTLIPELKSFLAQKDPQYRLLFLVDEVSQYIGKNKELLLNFQNIIERVSIDCKNQVWIACTAQQTLDEVASGVDGLEDVQDEFGKILGRFDTRISLQSNDAAKITQKRVLEKSSKGSAALAKIWEDNKDYLENQFRISHELYKGYQTDDEFILAYPFVPYQFKLIADVFDAFQQLKFVEKQVKDNARSLIGITHFTAIKCADDEVGGFVPFDAFFNQQFQTNLIHRGTRAIDNAFNFPYVNENPFAMRVVKTLFLISHLQGSQKQTFPSNIDNLTVLMMDKLDQNKMQLQNAIKTVLDKLIEGSIIREENSSYFFFNEDEIDVQNLIKSQVISFDDRLTQFNSFFSKIANIGVKVSYGTNDFKMGYLIEEMVIFRSGDFDLIVLVNSQATLEQKALSSSKMDLVIGVNEWFIKDSGLRRDFDWYCKTINFFKNNGTVTTGERAKTIENFKIRNKSLGDTIRDRIIEKFPETRFVSQNQVIEADQISGSTPADRVKNIIEKHLSAIYKNQKLASEYAQNQADLKKSAADTQVMIPILTPAEVVLNDFITLHNNSVTVYDLINEFAKPTFGWRHEAVLDILVHLVKKKKREFSYRSTPRFPIVDFINKAVSTPERMVCLVQSGEEIDQATIDRVIRCFKEIFNRDLPSTTDGNILYDTLLSELKRYAETNDTLIEAYHGSYPFGTCFHEADKKLKRWIETRDPNKLFVDFTTNSDASTELFDKTKGITEFASQQIKDYDAIKKFYESNTENFTELSPDNQEQAERINDFLKLDDPRKEYRHARKAYDELKHALSQYTSDLRSEVIELYGHIFDDLDKEATIQGVIEPLVYASREYTFQKIKELKSVPQLKNKKLSAGDFKSEQITFIIKSASSKTPKEGEKSVVGEPEAYYITNIKATISNKQELEEYLTIARKDMTKLLEAHKTIIIK
jgi:hypothetical protein